MSVRRKSSVLRAQIHLLEPGRQPLNVPITVSVGVSIAAIMPCILLCLPEVRRRMYAVQGCTCSKDRVFVSLPPLTHTVPMHCEIALAVGETECGTVV